MQEASLILGPVTLTIIDLVGIYCLMIAFQTNNHLHVLNFTARLKIICTALFNELTFCPDSVCYNDL